MDTAESLAIISAGIFFLTGLLTGVWKYLQIMASDKARAHYYVDICHRASLMYAFAALLLAKFAEISQLDKTIELVAVSVVVIYFAMAIFTYLIHGLLKDTNNQLKTPHQLGSSELKPSIISLFMWSLIIAEIGGFVVLFYGVVVAVI